jgi:hypothetical protein
MVLGSTFASSACTSETADAGPLGSSGVSFDDLVVSVSASSNGVSALVDARVNSRSLARQVNLEGGDAIFVEDGTSRRELAPFTGGAVLVFPTEATRFDVVLVRGASENRSLVALPAPFVLTAPAKASRVEGFTVGFDPDETFATSFTIGGSCSSSQLTRIAKAKATEITVNGADLAVTTLPCKVDVRAERVIENRIQERTVQVELVP